MILGCVILWYYVLILNNTLYERVYNCFELLNNYTVIITKKAGMSSNH